METHTEITKENAAPGTEVMYGEHLTVILQGSYDDPELGFMLKTARFPGGYPAKEFHLLNEAKNEQPAETLPAVTFVTQILDEKEPVKITADLIRLKSKPLTDLQIESIFDDAGYAKVKKARMEFVKLRTSIEKIEKAHLKTIKERHAIEIAEVKSYTDGLYTACREGEDSAQAKLTTIDLAKDAEVKRLAEEKRQKTEAREQKMFEMGMVWNGQFFSGYGTVVTKDTLFGYSAEAYATFIADLEGAQMEHGITGNTAQVQAPPIEGFAQRAANAVSGFNSPAEAKKEYATAVLDIEIPEKDVRFIITRGMVEDPGEALRANIRILESAYFLTII